MRCNILSEMKLGQSNWLICNMYQLFKENSYNYITCYSLDNMVCLLAQLPVLNSMLHKISVTQTKINVMKEKMALNCTPDRATIGSPLSFGRI